MFTNLYSQLQALSDPIRMTLCMLMLEHAGNLSVNELVERTNARLHRSLSQSTVSHHIRILFVAGLVTCHKDSQWNYYQFNQKAYQQALDALQAWLPVRETSAVA